MSIVRLFSPQIACVGDCVVELFLRVVRVCVVWCGVCVCVRARARGVCVIRMMITIEQK